MFMVAKRHPMLDLHYHLEHRIGQIFTEPLGTSEWSGAGPETADWLPVVDIYEEPDVVHLVAELPGVKPDDVMISVEGNRLTIKGTKEPVAENAEKVHRYERTYGAFAREFRLSVAIDSSMIKATYDLGVLTITLPKAETAKLHQIKVEVAAEKALLTP